VWTRNYCAKTSKQSLTHIHFNKIHNSTRAVAMSTKATLSLLTLPVELVYRILDNLDSLTILLSVRGVCTRLNLISDTYHPYQVNFIFLLQCHLHLFQTYCLLEIQIMNMFHEQIFSRSCFKSLSSILMRLDVSGN